MSQLRHLIIISHKRVMDLAINHPDAYIQCCEDLDLSIMSTESLDIFEDYLQELDFLRNSGNPEWSESFKTRLYNLGIWSNLDT